MLDQLFVAGLRRSVTQEPSGRWLAERPLGPRGGCAPSLAHRAPWPVPPGERILGSGPL